MMREIWTPELTSGAAWLDELHYGIAISLRRAGQAHDRAFPAAYTSLVADIELAFREEEKRMDDADPALVKSHREQHARVLRGLHCAHTQVLDGDIALGREIAIELLPRWLGWHIAAMDIPLAKATMHYANDNASTRSPCISVS
ncbi:MAG: hypothetical protein Q7U14_07070 [Lacisediminimonas sp.]|nr:hypothetical protein [Lacisediminimonas sp.]